MTKLGVEVTDATMGSLERRVARLVVLIEQATITSQDKKIRENGAQLADRLHEWLDDIKDLREIGDQDVLDLVKSFSLRLRMAEAKVRGWPLPPSAQRDALLGVRRKRGRAA